MLVPSPRPSARQQENPHRLSGARWGLVGWRFLAVGLTPLVLIPAAWMLSVALALAYDLVRTKVRAGLERAVLVWREYLCFVVGGHSGLVPGSAQDESARGWRLALRNFQ